MYGAKHARAHTKEMVLEIGFWFDISLFLKSCGGVHAKLQRQKEADEIWPDQIRQAKFVLVGRGKVWWEISRAPAFHLYGESYLLHHRLCWPCLADTRSVLFLIVTDVRATSLTRFIKNTCNIYISK